MGKTQVRATLLATTAVLSLIASANANVVLDPGFESGAFGTWVSGGGPFNAINGINPRSGTFSFRGGCNVAGCVAVGATGVSGTGTARQTINLQPGIYQGSFYYRASGFTLNRLAVSLGNNTVVNLTNTTAAPYTRFQFVSAASGGPTNLVFGIRNDPDFDNIDDVSLELVDDGEGNNIGAAAQTVAVQASREFLDRLQDRFNHAGSPIRTASVRETVVASAGGLSYVNASGQYRAFMSVFGSDGEWDDSATTADRRGFSAGIEANVGSLDIGAAFSLSRTDFDTQTIFTQNEGEAEEMLGAIYAHWSPSSTPVYFNLIAGYGQSSNDLTRTAFFDLGLDGNIDSAQARDVDSSQWFASAEVGFDWAVSQNFMLTPFARVDGAMIEQDGYTEVAFALSSLPVAVVAGRDFDALRSIVGVRAGLDLDIGRGGKLGAKVGWAHDFEQDRFVTFTETTGPVSFAGVAGAATPAEDSVVAGASIELAVSDEAAIYAGYNGDFADEQEIHAGEVGLRVTW
ncbi:MAG: autotransporter domain-containing protein [Alphaproteobacteria bacterium]|nr:autotransporter domain-containing protein [Alphaproteobacteria bacterium]